MITVNKNKSFKTIQIVFWFKEKLNLETIGYRFLLGKLLRYATDQNPTPKQFNEKLSFLYGTRLVENVKLTKDSHFICYVLTLPDPKIMEESHLLEETLTLVKEMIYDRNLFNEKHFKVVKQTSLDMIDKIKEDKTNYGKLKYYQSIYKEHPFGQMSTGSKKLLESITLNDLYQYYQNEFLNNDLIITVNGNLEDDDIKLIENTFKKSLTIEKKYEYNPFVYPNEAVIKEEQISMQQALIYMGYHSPITYFDPLYEAMLLLTIIIGSSPESRLFKIIREEQMLAYDVDTEFDFDRGLLTLYAGVDTLDKDQALSKMMEIMESILDYGVSYDELYHAKSYLKSVLYTSLDYQLSHSIESFIHLLYHQNLTLEERIQRIDVVTIEMIKEALDSLRLTNIFILHGGDEIA